MKNTIPLAFLLLLLGINCESKKKQFIPLQTIIQEDANKDSATKNGSSIAPTSNSSTTTTVPTSNSNNTAPETNTTTSGSNEIPQTTGTNTTTSSSNEIPQNTETNGTTQENVQPDSATVAVGTGTIDPFTYQTTTTIPVNMVVTNTQGTPIHPATVTITDPTENNVLLQQVTGANGSVTGSITVPTTTTHVDVTVASGNTSQTIDVPLQVSVTTNGTTTSQPINSIGNITLPPSNPNGSGTQIADRDGDGVDDMLDFYPDDPTKATKIRFPANGVNTIAYEDLYPKAGDADLNDYVIQFYNEEDLNAQGQIVEVRGIYQHVARGAGYRHTLNLLLPNTVNISYESTVTDANGTLQNTGITKYTPTPTQLEEGLSILGNSGTTINSPNVQLNQSYSPGHVAKIKIIFNTPIARNVIGAAPYNIYLHVNNTNQNIHFPGKYFDSEGNDKFMDSNGFPWAIMVPGIWSWPLERKDIRNATVTGYPRFNSWATSKGVTDKDWYTTVTSGKVYPLPSEPSNLLAYLKGEDLHTNIFMAIALIAFGIFMGFVFRKKLTST